MVSCRKISILILFLVVCAIGQCHANVFAQSNDQDEDTKPNQILKFDAQVTVVEQLDRATVVEEIKIQLGQDPKEGKEETEKKEKLSWFLIAVPMGDAELENLQMEWKGLAESDSTTAVRLDLKKNVDGLWQAEIPDQVSQFKPSTSSTEIEFKISYEVISGKQRLWVPLVFPNWKPADTTNQSLFTASVSFPAKCKWVESFPNQSSASEETKTLKTRSFELSAIPSVLWFRLAGQDESAIATGTLIDFAVLAVLVLLGFAGWKYRRLLT